VDRQERAESRGGRRVAEATGGDERDGSGRASDDVAERASRLTEREIERGALERPAAVVLEVVAVGASGNSGTVPRWREKLSSVHSPARGRTAPRACWASCRSAVVRDVLTEALFARARQPDHRGPAQEVARAGYSWPFELVALDDEREVADEVVQRHQSAANATAISPARRRSRRSGRG
jgi:hypothetical protein